MQIVEGVDRAADRMEEAVRALADTLQVPVEHLLEASMRYVVVENAMQIVSALFMWALLALGLRGFVKAVCEIDWDAEEATEADKRSSMHLVLSGVVVLIGIVGVLVCTDGIGEAVALVAAPEVGVLKMVGELLK